METEIPLKCHFSTILLCSKKSDIGMSSADPPDRFDRSAGAARHQPCGDNFLSLPVLTMVKNTQVGVLISNLY